MDDVGLMRPGPTLTLAEAEEEERRRRGLRGLAGAVSEPLMYSPMLPLGMAAGAVNQVADKGWEKGLAATVADLAMGAAVRNGPQLIKAMGPASKLDPSRLDALRKTLKAGTSPEDAYTYFRMLPMLDKSGKLVDDAWTPVIKPLAKLSKEFLDIRQELNNNFAKMQLHGKETLPLERAYATGEADKLFNAYPETAKTPVTLTTGLKPSEGELVRGSLIRIGAGTPLSGRKNLAAVLAHEGTHLVQRQPGLDVPTGGNPTSVGTDKRRALNRAKDNYLLSGPTDMASLEARDKTLKALEQRLNSTHVGPGIESERMISEIEDPALRKIALLLAWGNRQVDNLDYPDYTLYKGLHGEQIPEGAAMNAVGLPPKFTTPLAKQPISLEEIESGNYQLRMQKLYDAIMRGEAFDPKLKPFSLP
jgi:hypothetical protein